MHLSKPVILAAALAAVLPVSVSLAQPPAAPSPITQPVAEDQADYIPYGAPITLAEAHKAMEPTLAVAHKHHWHLACAVVEPGGELVLLEKMDDTQYASIDIAQAKARAAARFRRSIKVFLDAVKGGNTAMLSLPGMLAGEGAFPILKEGKVIGAIGCSGAASNQDATAALAGAEAFK